jgi:hypothetical protein
MLGTYTTCESIHLYTSLMQAHEGSICHISSGRRRCEHCFRLEKLTSGSNFQGSGKLREENKLHWSYIHVEWSYIHVEWSYIHVEWSYIYVEWPYIHVEWSYIHVELVHIVLLYPIQIPDSPL